MDEIDKLREAGGDDPVVFRKMREDTGGAVLDTVFRISKGAATAFAQRIERTIAKEAIKFKGIASLVTGKVFAVCI